ncbi:hypothetical protein [Lignipirellula cremea]|uniref:Uncharacterized protein n=1 Tax=Lignipirellula cremea TaxID=2528010 RepID=A0A518DSN1_9BACT|nr:hypothetical protein [Lignipirellula cremea]QDU94845.1 hypothetical protein Pla8534_26530 [Lignipirellula cremea]
MPRFFVMHLSEQDLCDRGQVNSQKPFEIQMLDKQDRARAVGYVSADDESLEISGYKIPTPVIEAACRQVAGRGEYVDEQGMSIKAF